MFGSRDCVGQQGRPCSKPIRDKAQHGCIKSAPLGPHSARCAPELHHTGNCSIHRGCMYLRRVQMVLLYGELARVGGYAILRVWSIPVSGCQVMCKLMVAFSSLQGMVHFLPKFERALCGKMSCAQWRAAHATFFNTQA